MSQYPVGQHVVLLIHRQPVVKKVLGTRTRPGMYPEVCIDTDTGGNLAHWRFISDLVRDFTGIVLYFDWQEHVDSQTIHVRLQPTLEAARDHIITLAEQRKPYDSATPFIEALLPGIIYPIDYRHIRP